MPRTKLIEQAKYEFSCTVTLQPRDINYGGHMGSDNLVSLLTTARVFLFSGLGCSEVDLGDHKTGLIMSDLVVNYKAQAFMLDEVTIETHGGEFSRKGFRLFYRVSKKGALIALAETGVVTYDYKAQEIAPPPESILKAFKGDKERAENLPS